MDWLDFDATLTPLLTDPRHPVHELHMRLALDEAALALESEDVPVGAVIASFDQGIIAKAHNERELLQDPTAHAEMLALTQAAHALGTWRLHRCIMYVTLEPCPMCAGALVNARLPFLIYGAADGKAGACHSLYQITNDPRLNHRLQVLGGVLAEECAGVLGAFFRQRRQRRP
jgi:tRNA(adenine34) deaminase